MIRRSPPVSSARSGPGDIAPSTLPLSHFEPVSNPFISGSASTKMDWNSTNMTARNASVPQTLWISTRSSESVHVVGRTAGTVTAFDVTARM